MSTKHSMSVGFVWGFAAAVAMWCLAFIGHIPGIPQMPAALGVVLLLTQLVGAMATRGPLAGLVASFTTAAVNLLALGSVLTEVQTDATQQVVQQEAVPGAAIY